MAEIRPELRVADKPLASERARMLDRLYRRYAGWLARALAVRLRTTPLEIDDIVQETYVRMSRYADADAERHPQSLLLRIAVNLARDQMRRNAVRGKPEAANDETMPELAVAADQHEGALLKQAILALPPIYRDVFVLSRFTGLTYEEIASHVGVSVKTVEWRMGKALAMCAECLRD